MGQHIKLWEGTFASLTEIKHKLLIFKGKNSLKMKNALMVKAYRTRS